MPKRTFEPELLPLPVVARKTAAPPTVASPETAGAATGPTGHSFTQISTLAPQTKLSVNQPGDLYEAEADSMANQVMAMSDADGVQRASVNLSVSRQDDGGVTPADDVSGVVDDGLSGGGQPLDSETRSFMEPRFGVNFSDVRIHTDSKASDSSHALDARAYAVGSNIAFRSGEYSPGSSEGKRLLAHELTHVVQQGGAGSTDEVAPKLEASRMRVQRFQAGPSGHGGIEEKGLVDAGFPVNEASQVYFGNWMRDFSQLPPAAWPVINILSLGEFGHGVTPDELGAYVPSEHLDNPLGGGTVEDPSLTPAQKQAEYEKLSPDQKAAYDRENAHDDDIKAASAKSGLPEYIERGKMHSKDMFTQAAQQGENEQGNAMLGNGLHAVEDYFAHSNFVEAAQYEISHGTAVPTSANPPPAPDQSKPFDPATAMGVDANGHPKIYTGTYKDDGNKSVSILETIKTEIHSGTLAQAFAVGVLKMQGIDSSEVRKKAAEKKGEESALGQVAGAVAGGIGGFIGGMEGGIEGLYGGSGSEASGRAAGEASGSAYGSGAVGSLYGAVQSVEDAPGDLMASIFYGSLEAIANALRKLEIELDTSALGGLVDAIIEEKVKAGTQESAEKAPVDPATGQALPTHSQIAKDSPDHPNYAAASALAQQAVTEISAAMKNIWGGRTTPSPDPVDATAVNTLVDKYVATPESGTWWKNVITQSSQADPNAK